MCGWAHSCTMSHVLHVLHGQCSDRHVHEYIREERQLHMPVCVVHDMLND